MPKVAAYAAQSVTALRAKSARAAIVIAALVNANPDRQQLRGLLLRQMPFHIYPARPKPIVHRRMQAANSAAIARPIWSLGKIPPRRQLVSTRQH